MKDIMDKNKHNDFIKMLDYRPKKRGNNIIDNKKTEVTNYIEKEIKTLLSSLIIKQNYIADRYETLEMSKRADEYISTVKGYDNFWTYKEYSEYALNKAGITDMRCKYDKRLIPEKLRKEVVIYQREYIKNNYIEMNNYYRCLAGLPDVADDFIFTDINDPDVDSTKPIHTMTQDELIILSVNGELDKLKKKYPDKKYLNHLLDSNKVDIVTARTAADFDILSIKRDRNRELLVNQFIAVYNESKLYVLARFRDDAYIIDNHNEYYDGFIGMLILIVAIQRFISNFYYNLINRDFFNKDIIRNFFVSYNIPFYENIPLGYLNNIAKNLNRLLMYKATDKVFVNIFKIFGLKNVNIQNYILFKDIKFDNNNNPIQVYKENKDFGYIVNTKTTSLISTSKNVYNKNINKTNIDKIRYFNWKGKMYKLYYRFNKMVSFDDTVPVNIFNELSYTKSDTNVGEYDFTENINIIDVFEIDDDDKPSFVLLTREMYLYYLCDTGIKKYDLNEIANGVITNVIFKYDPHSHITCVGLNYINNCEIFVKGDFRNAKYDELTCVHRLKYDTDKIVDIALNGESIIATINNGAIYVMGDNSNSKLHIKNMPYIEMFTEVINNAPMNVIRTVICEKGSIFIISDGSVRWTGEIKEFGMNKTVPGFNDVKSSFRNVKNIYILNDGNKKFGIVRLYNDIIILYNYKYSDKFGSLLYNNQLYNQKFCKYKFIKDLHIYPKLNEILITQYNQHIYSNASVSKNTDDKFSFNMILPYIQSSDIIEETNVERMYEIEICEDILYFTNEFNELKYYDYINKKYTKLDIDGIPQSIFSTKFGLFVTTGTNHIYKITKDDGCVKVNTNNKIIVEVIDNTDETVLISSNNDILIYQNGNIKESQNFNPKTNINNVHYEIYFSDKDNKYHIILKDAENNVDKPINGLYNCINILVYNDIIILNGDRLSYIKYDDIMDNDINILTPVELEDMNKYRERYKVIGNDIINFNFDGGISLLSKFSQIKTFNVDIDDYYVSLYGGDPNTFISDFTMNKNSVLFLRNKNETITYSPDYEKMYDLHFVEVPFDTENLSVDLCKNEKFSQYELIVNDDSLWGDEDNKSDFKKQILESEFNYIYTKYISVTSTYDITRLNFETCYMFKMLDDLKINEKYLMLTLPYVGDCRLFDVVVSLYALANMKMGMDGNIIDTSTKALSVLGFNFKQDLKYLEKILSNNELYEKIDINKISINQPPKIYSETSEVVNTFLSNKDVYDYIYKAKWESKDILEYNAYKRIQQATLYSNYSSEMYRINGKIPSTYLEYIRQANISLYRFLKETDETNIVNQIDIILTTLDEYLHSDKFEYLFNNIPSLSMDNIRRFIYYLIETFKSYKIELKSLNIVYEVDDKYIHNIKLVLDEDGFKKVFQRRDIVIADFSDMFSTMHKVLKESDDIELVKEIILRAIDTKLVYLKLDETTDIEASFTDYDILLKSFCDALCNFDKTHSESEYLKLIEDFTIALSYTHLSKLNIHEDINMNIISSISDSVIKSFSDIFSDVRKSMSRDDNIIKFIRQSIFKAINLMKSKIKISHDVEKECINTMDTTILLKNIPGKIISYMVGKIVSIKFFNAYKFNSTNIIKEELNELIIDKLEGVIGNNVLNDVIPLNISDNITNISNMTLNDNIKLSEKTVFIRNQKEEK